MLQRHKKLMFSAQIQVLRRTTGAYATASTDCLPVVAGVLPMDLYLEKRINFYWIRIDLPTVIGENYITAADYDDPDGRTRIRQLADETY